MTAPKPGVLLMTYGSPDSLAREDVRSYLARVRGGREPDSALVDEFTRRYRVIGGSPLIDITRAQAADLARALGWRVEIGMRFSEPSIAAGLSALVDAGVADVAAIILSPQYSPTLMSGYAKAIEVARSAMSAVAPVVTVAGSWYEQPAFITALAGRVSRALDALPPGERDGVRVLMTAHSVPKHVAASEPDYLAQLQWTAEAVAGASGLSADRWTFCWQSAGHEPGEWMKPDFADLMPGISESRTRSVLVAPIQFLADHLETLYDVEVGAREQAEAHGVEFHKIASLNSDPGLISALAVVATETILGSRRASSASQR